jgi:hypothetical protein
MAKPVAKVKVGDLMTADKMNEIIASINDLEKRLEKLESKAPKKKTPEINIPKKKTLRAKNPKGKTVKVKTPTRKIQKKKSPKAGFLSRIALVK